MGGYNAAGSSELSAEVIPLDVTNNNNATSCANLGDLPDGRSHALGGVFGDKLVVCGGYKLTDCVSYNEKRGVWDYFADLGGQHWDGVAVQIDDKMLWIAGGRDRDAEEVVKSSVILKV